MTCADLCVAPGTACCVTLRTGQRSRARCQLGRACTRRTRIGGWRWRRPCRAPDAEATPPRHTTGATPPRLATGTTPGARSRRPPPPAPPSPPRTAPPPGEGVYSAPVTPPGGRVTSHSHQRLQSLPLMTSPTCVLGRSAYQSTQWTVASGGLVIYPTHIWVDAPTCDVIRGRF